MDSSDEESEGAVVTARDLAALRTLADNRNLRGTTAIWLHQAARSVQASPGYPGGGSTTRRGPKRSAGLRPARQQPLIGLLRNWRIWSA